MGSSPLIDIMIFKQTILKNVDNSGVTWSKCIHIEGRCNKNVGRLGEKILISTFRIKIKNKIKKKKYSALIIGTKRFTKRIDGSFIKFFKNKTILLSDQLKLLGSRIYGPIPKELSTIQKEVLYKKLVTYSCII
jgi:large subunit ribosomal protein L14